MTWLAFVLVLEAGWLPHGGFAMYQVPAVIDVTGSFYVDMQAEAVAWKHLYLNGGMKTFMWSQEGNWTFWPHTELYNVGAGVRLGVFDLGWRHYCVHPVMPYSILYDPVLKAEGSWDEVFLRVEVRLN